MNWGVNMNIGKLKKIVLPMILCNTLFAQEGFDILDLEELVNTTITTSTRKDETLLSVPSSVTVFNKKEIEQLGASTLLELMGYVPGFQNMSSGTAAPNEPFSSRGRRMSTFVRSVLILLNGKRLNTDYSGNFSSFNASVFPLYTVDRVEFIRGPGSALYGSNALMGVINIITNDEISRVQLKSGSQEHKQIIGQYSKTFANDVHLSLNADYTYDGGYEYKGVYDKVLSSATGNIEETDIKDPYKITNILLNINSDRFSFQGYFTKNIATDWLLSRRISDNNEFHTKSAIIDFDYYFDLFGYDNRVGLGYKKSMISGTTALYSELLLDSIYTQINSAYGLNLDAVDDLMYKTLSRQNSIDLTWDMSGDNFIVGVETRKVLDTVSSSASNYDLSQLLQKDFPLSYYNGSYDWVLHDSGMESNNLSVLGIYGQYQHELFDNTTLTTGLRYDYYSSYGSSLNPRLALVHSLNKEHSLKVLYAEAFRTPSILELDINTLLGVSGNSDLEAEKSKTTELVYIYQNDKGTNFSTSIFHSEIENGIIETGSNARTFENEGVQVYQGVEVESRFALTKSSSLRLNATKLINLPENAYKEADILLGAILNYKINSNITTNFSIYYNGSRDFYDVNDTKQKLEPYTIANLYISYKLDDIKMFTQIKNITDTDYTTPPSDASMPEGIPRRGRTYLVGLEYKF
jgi:outer membrane receptor protein involved in Fe transport